VSEALLVVAGVAIAAVLAEALVAVTFARWARSMQRQYARERELLVNQLCNVVGRPWAPAPADEWEPEAELSTLVSSPEQLPDY
jgi:hypothetical protein